MAALTEGLQDYLEAILLCSAEHKFVRTKHLAEKLGVKSPSVNAAVKELARLGFVEHESYGYIELTAEGRRQAECVYSRHKILYRFFAKTLSLPNDLAEDTACGIEHHLDELTLKKITRLLDFLERKREKCEKFATELKEALKDD